MREASEIMARIAPFHHFTHATCNGGLSSRIKMVRDLVSASHSKSNFFRQKFLWALYPLARSQHHHLSRQGYTLTSSGVRQLIGVKSDSQSHHRWTVRVRFPFISKVIYRIEVIIASFFIHPSMKYTDLMLSKSL